MQRPLRSNFWLHGNLCSYRTLCSPPQAFHLRYSVLTPPPAGTVLNPLRFFPSGAPCFSPQVLLLMYFISSGFVPSGTPCSLVQVLGAHTHARRCYHLCSGSQAENLHVHILAPCSPCSGTLCSHLLSNSILTLCSPERAGYPMLSLLRCPEFTLLRYSISPCSGTLCSPLLRLYLY